MVAMMEITQNEVLSDSEFEDAVRNYRERIFLLVFRYVRNRDDAHDITQDTFVRAYKARKSFKGHSNIYTWLHRIAVNLSLNFKTRNKTSAHKSIDDYSLTDHDKSISDKLEQNEISNKIDKSVMELPPRQRMAFNLRYYEEMPYSEISESMGISEGAAKANYHQAIKNMRKTLKPLLRGDVQ